MLVSWLIDQRKDSSEPREEEDCKFCEKKE